jgi:two-component system, sensor histidine kinase PdtaS
MKSGYSRRHLPAIRLLLAILEIILLQAAQAQQTGSSEADTIIEELRSGIADTPRVQMLLRLSSFYLHKTLNPIRDMDSALVLAGQALDLAQRLKFVSGEEDAIFLKGKIYIKQQNTVKVQQMLKNVSSENRIRLLLELGKSMLRTPYLQKGNRDSAILFFREAGKLSDRIGNQKLKEESQFLLGAVYLVNGNWQQGKAYFTQVIEARQQARDKAGALKALLRMAITAFCDNCAENITALKRALELSLQIRDQSLEALIRLEMGFKHLNDGDAKQAEEQALAALKIQKAIGYPALCHAYKSWAVESGYSISDYDYLSNAYYLLSDLGQIKGDLNQKLLYILKVVDDVENSRMFEELDYTYFRLGNAYWELGQFDKSMEYHKRSIALSHQKGELIQVEMARRMTVALIKQGKAREALLLLQEIIDKKLLCDLEDKMYLAQSLGSCYNALKQYTTAEKYYLESVAWSKQLPVRFQFVAAQGTSEFYVANAQYSRAEPYLRLLLNAPSQQILPNYLKEVHLMWFKVDSARQDYPKAIRHYQRYKALQDSIFNETKSKQIAQLSIQYETATKDKNIELLVQKDKVQQATLRQSAIMRNVTLSGILVMLVVTGLVYSQYRNKQKRNKEINEKNRALEQLVKDKEWLVREIHHRVKNNFHIVASLLEIQSSYLKNKAALSAIKESQHRIHSMSIIHQKLYQSDTLSTIHMPEYIYELVEYLRESYSIRENIGVSLQIENIELNHASAITLGLILNEAITNAIKYAFAKTKDGKISISLTHLSDAQVLLSIADNGRGLPTDFDTKIGASMGMELLQGLTDDLGGNFSIETNNGTHIKIIFDYKPITAAPVSFS